ncbi:MAG: DUF3467 domain-containing protein [Chloroflexi bacterium]|nr:DUF3467 domain-containing protein [Chloroflexota bacterium]
MSDQPSPSQSPAPAPQPPQQIQLELPINLDAIYTNFAIITHSPSEVIIDYARVLPNTPKSKIVARIILTPMNAKVLHKALGDNLAKYEAQFGPIILPTGLADQLFKPPKPE